MGQVVTYEEFSVKLVHETEEAVLIDDGDNEIWLPKSQLDDFDSWTYEKGDKITIYLADWLAEKRGL